MTDDDDLARRCPSCGSPRLLPGPQYDRGRSTCMECGHVERLTADQWRAALFSHGGNDAA